MWLLRMTLSRGDRVGGQFMILGSGNLYDGAPHPALASLGCSEGTRVQDKALQDYLPFKTSALTCYMSSRKPHNLSEPR